MSSFNVRWPKMFVCLLSFFLIVSAIAFTPQNAGAWPGDKTVNIQTHANAAGFQWWWTVKCTRAELYVNGQTIYGTIFDRRTNGCKAEWLNVPVNTPFTYKIFGEISQVTKVYVSGSNSSGGVPAQTWGRTAVLPEIYLR